MTAFLFLANGMLLEHVTGNVAFNKSCSQSEGAQDDDTQAARAVDGHSHPVMINQNCARPTRHDNIDAWWTVDLGGTYTMSSVIVHSTTRRKCSIDFRLFTSIEIIIMTDLYMYI